MAPKAVDTQMASYYSDICGLLYCAVNSIPRNNVGRELTLTEARLLLTI